MIIRSHQVRLLCIVLLEIKFRETIYLCNALRVYVWIAMHSLVSQTPFPWGGAYRLEVISTPSEGSGVLPIPFCSEESTDFVDC